MLQITDLNIAYQKTPIVKHLSMQVQPREIVGIVGESGSGKSTLIRSILGILGNGGKVTSGEILFENEALQNKKNAAMRELRGSRIAMIFQHPERSFDPTYTIEMQFSECMRVHGKITKEQAIARAETLLRELNFPEPKQILKAYPFELSGGMCQRVAIALAMANQPKLLLADEPTSALDVTVQAQILDLIKRLQKEMDMSVIYITHDLGVVANVADRVAVMYAGQIVEHGLANEIFKDARHPYTKALLNSIFDVYCDQKEEIQLLKGEPPSPLQLQSGCPFAKRCKSCMEQCKESLPQLKEVSAGHFVACFLTGQTSHREEQ